MRERDVLGHTIISMVTSSGVKGTLHAVHAAVMDSLPLPEVRHPVYHTKILKRGAGNVKAPFESRRFTKPPFFVTHTLST